MAFCNILLIVVVVSATGLASNEVDSCLTQGDALLQVGRSERQHLVVEDTPSFKVLVVGAPRTGTQSLAVALKRLGFSPLHSAYQRLRLPWCNYLTGKASFEEAMQTMNGFDSAMDEPFHLIYEQVMRRFPDCKFVLTQPEPEKWFASCQDFWSRHREPVPGSHFEYLQGPSSCQNLHYFGCNFTAPQTPELKERCIDGYRSHNEDVKRLVPAERLLVFNFSDGFRPLAEFLGKPVPDEPFPYVDHFSGPGVSATASFSSSVSQTKSLAPHSMP